MYAPVRFYFTGLLSLLLLATLAPVGHGAMLVGFVLSLALAVFLGWVLARKVMAPVVRLARQVRHRDQLLGLVFRVVQLGVGVGDFA